MIRSRSDYVYLRIQGEFCHDASQRSQVAFIVQNAQVIEKLQSPHERFWRGGVDIVEPNEILNGDNQPTETNQYGGCVPEFQSSPISVQYSTS